MLALCLAATTLRADDRPGVVTMSGKIVCAKCTLHVPGQSACHNVLLIRDAERETRYWLVKNHVDRAFGDVCAGEKPVTVTGTTKDERGKWWITPTAIDVAPKVD